MGIFSNPARDEQGNELRRRKTDQIPFSIIASDMTVIGDLETEGVVRIEGRVKGTVRGGAQVLVATGAVIEGDLHTQEAVIAGQVSGSIRASEDGGKSWTDVSPADWEVSNVALGVDGANLYAATKRGVYRLPLR